jgi:seryl-tRNA synthetase
MHDIRVIRENPEAFDKALARRGFASIAQTILDKDRQRREWIGLRERSISEVNNISRLIGEARRRGQDTTELERTAAELKAQVQGGLDAMGLKAVEKDLFDTLASIPNMLDAEVPDGADENANVVLKQVGQPADFAFSPKQHFELGEALGLMDFTAAGKISGSRFTILRGALARMERALGQFMLDLHTSEHGYSETIVPLLVNDGAVFGTGQLPKFADDLFVTKDGRWLIPTAEVPLTNMVAGEILAEKALPLRLTALSECFRSEAGAAGRDTRGMLRQHQFRKVELVSICHPDASEAEHERMTRCAERVLELLELPYRRVLLSSGDTGFSAARTYDLEVWMPGQQAWREISSCSNTRAFQARRMNARFRAADGKAVAHVHTLNGSGVAVGRALIAVMENHQQSDGSIAVPLVLARYMGGLERIAAAAVP